LHNRNENKGDAIVDQQQEQPTRDCAPEKIEWNTPVLERLSMRATETANQVFRRNDGATNYS
jgi:hypothetical protein